MAINLIAKIAPKNDGFLGMVDARQVIGASGNGGFLPSSSISSNSLQEYQLNISNSPIDGTYLQYKDSTDELTWSTVSSSGASYWTSSNGLWYSGNVRVGDILRATNVVSYGSSGHPTGIGYYVETYMFGSVGRLFCYNGASYGDLAIGDWGAGNPNIMLKVGGNVGIGLGSPLYRMHINGSLYADSISGGSIQESILTTKLDDNYYPSSLGKLVTDSYYGHSSNSSIHYPSSQLKPWFDALYQPSGTGAQSYNGWASISDGGIIPHGCGSKPSYANVTPSGTLISFGITCIVDNANITVGMTAHGSRDVFWKVEV